MNFAIYANPKSIEIVLCAERVGVALSFGTQHIGPLTYGANYRNLHLPPKKVQSTVLRNLYSCTQAR